MRDYIKATVGFEKLAVATGTPAKSLIRMFGPRGNPLARNLFCVIGYLLASGYPAARHARAALSSRRPRSKSHMGGRAADRTPGNLKKGRRDNRLHQPRNCRPAANARASRAARQLPDQSTTLWVESSSTGDTRRRGALNRMG